MAEKVTIKCGHSRVAGEGLIGAQKAIRSYVSKALTIPSVRP